MGETRHKGKGEGGNKGGEGGGQGEREKGNWGKGKRGMRENFY